MRLTVKIGGSVLEDEASRRGLLGQLAGAIRRNAEIIVVHGGGKSLTRRLGQLGLASKFIAGLRVTDRETLAVAVMVLAGEVNKNLVRALGAAGVRAVGVCGVDAGCVRCEPALPPPGSSGDLGFVGIAGHVERGFFESLLGAGLTPVVASLALGTDQQIYNVNADQMASAIAGETGSDALVYLTDVDGVLDQAGNVIAHLSSAGIGELRRRGILTGGMLPKTSSALGALHNGVRRVCILPGRVPGVLSRLVDGQSAEGTSIHD